MLHEFACHPCTRAIANLLCIAPILVCVLPKQALHMYLFIYYVCVLSCFSHVQLFATPWTVAHHAPLPMGFSRQEYWSGLPCPSPGESSWLRDWTYLSYSSCTSGRFFTSEPPGKSLLIYYNGVQTALAAGIKIKGLRISWQSSS